MEILFTILIVAAVILFLGLCILVHEFGHLLVGLWRGLHIERFSIGFGRKLWATECKGVEYRISMLPFGGYVALPQLEPTDTPTTESGEPLPAARPTDRILTALAGPVANILFGFLLAALVWWVGVYRPEPVTSLQVYSVPVASAEYEAGLRPGDILLEVNGDPVKDWNDVVQQIALSSGAVDLTVARDGERHSIVYAPGENPDFEGVGFPFFQVKMPVEILGVKSGSPAERAGLQRGDRILTVDGEPVQSTGGFLDTMWESGGAPVDIVVMRDGRELTFEGVRGEPAVVDGETVHLIGVVPGEPMVLRHLSPWWQFKNVINTTKTTLGALFSPRSLVKPKHMSGPVGIVRANYLIIRYQGWRQGLFFVVFVSFSLAIFNLLPFPVLDGGHIMFGLFEGLTPWRVPERVAYWIQTVFAVALISLMLYVTFYDLRRVTGDLFPGDAEDTQTEESSPPTE